MNIDIYDDQRTISSIVLPYMTLLYSFLYFIECFMYFSELPDDGDIIRNQASRMEGFTRTLTVMMMNVFILCIKWQLWTIFWCTLELKLVQFRNPHHIVTWPRCIYNVLTYHVVIMDAGRHNPVDVCGIYKQRWSVGPPDQDFRKNTVYNLYSLTAKPHLLAG